ncbi:MAG: transposase [Chthoniobacter sp.]|uniref:REP-associated tyrosine transposase n=1 Tax=Chthoniobacter sp. TaxID=2510640 RepID=UPI0032A46439
MNRTNPKYREHLRRLDRVWVREPVYFVTTCTRGRVRILDNPSAYASCVEVWEKGQELHGWQVGRYVVMPDHVHFFCAPEPGAKDLKVFVGKWKEWTAKFLNRRLGASVPLWQEEFFDHLLRSHESYAQKWDYVQQNPVRAGLAAGCDDWPYQGCLNDLRVEEAL